ncbi:MAG: polymer-forming cytoskeletal protein [Candidatus Hydrogenedentes bacterium]|nr:polymer-forming cytoskeletal protein [Candidatus Hydrogenedentota bacterium]
MLDRSEPRKDLGAAAKPQVQWKPVEPPVQDAPDTYEALEKAGKKDSILGRWLHTIDDKLTTNRGPARVRSAAEEAGESPNVTADDLAIRRAKTVKPVRMVVPEGVIIEGNMTSGSETEISGRIEGNVTVEGRLYLGASALVTGNIRATSCVVEGLVEGKVECSEDLELGRTGRLNADAMAGKEMNLGGQVFGNISTGGVARLRATARLTGNIRTRRIVIDEGALFNGTCTMRTPSQRADAGGAQKQLPL